MSDTGGSLDGNLLDEIYIRRDPGAVQTGFSQPSAAQWEPQYAPAPLTGTLVDGGEDSPWYVPPQEEQHYPPVPFLNNTPAPPQEPQRGDELLYTPGPEQNRPGADELLYTPGPEQKTQGGDELLYTLAPEQKTQGGDELPNTPTPEQTTQGGDELPNIPEPAQKTQGRIRRRSAPSAPEEEYVFGLQRNQPHGIAIKQAFKKIPDWKDYKGELSDFHTLTYRGPISKPGQENDPNEKHPYSIGKSILLERFDDRLHAPMLPEEGLSEDDRSRMTRYYLQLADITNPDRLTEEMELHGDMLTQPLGDTSSLSAEDKYNLALENLVGYFRKEHSDITKIGHYSEEYYNELTRLANEEANEASKQSEEYNALMAKLEEENQAEATQQAEYENLMRLAEEEANEAANEAALQEANYFNELARRAEEGNQVETALQAEPYDLTRIAREPSNETALHSFPRSSTGAEGQGNRTVPALSRQGFQSTAAEATGIAQALNGIELKLDQISEALRSDNNRAATGVYTGLPSLAEELVRIIRNTADREHSRRGWY